MLSSMLVDVKDGEAFLFADPYAQRGKAGFVVNVVQLDVLPKGRGSKFVELCGLFHCHCVDPPLNIDADQNYRHQSCPPIRRLT